MNRRSSLVPVTIALSAGVLVVGAAAATADNHEQPAFPQHGHMLLLDAEAVFGAGPPQIISYETCIDLANNRVLRLNAHHEHLHFGPAGEAQRRAGNLIVPVSPFPGGGFSVPWSDCASFANILPPS